MRPLSLNMQYFGPFIDEKVDFRHLSKSQLFLICGKTGSGKTMIFDAMVYALFGKTSTESREEVDLRSHFADPKLPTEVQFEFEIKGESYLVTRTVKYIKEGNKNPTNATVEVYKKVNDKWELETKSINTSNDYLKQLLHMNVKQFRQILILPQGEFKQFLVSNSTDKRSILRTLFDSDRFEELQEQLESEMKKELALIESHYQKISQYMSDMHDFEDEQLKDIKAIEGYRYQTIMLSIDLYDKVGNEKLKVSLAEKEKQEKQVSEIEKAFENEKTLNENFNTLYEKEALLKALRKDEAEINDLRKHLKYLKTVQSMTYQYNQLTDKEQALNLEIKNEEELQQSIERNKLKLNELTERLSKLNEDSVKIEQYRRFVQNTKHIKMSLNKYLEAETKLPKVIEEQQALNKETDKDKQELQTFKNKLNAISYDESEEQNKTKHQETLKLNLQDLQTKQKQYHEKLELLEKQQAYTSELVKLEKEKAHFEEKLKVKRQFDILSVEDEILKIQQHVHQGDDCPICGSMIETINGDYDFESLRKEKAQQLEVEQSLQGVIYKMTTYNERLKLTKEQLDKLMDISDVQTEIDNTTEQINQLVNEIQLYRERRQYKQSLQNQIHDIEKGLTQNELQLNDLKNQITIYENDVIYFKQETKFDEVVQFEEQVQQYEKALTVYDDELNQLNVQVDKCKEDKQGLQMKAATVKERKSMIEEQIKLTRDYLSREMEQHQITSYEQLDELLQQINDIDEHEEKINQFDKKYIEVEAVVKELGKKVKDKERPDTLKTEHLLNDAKETLSVIVKQLNQLQLKIDQNKQKSTAIKGVVDKIEHDLQEQAEMIELSRIMNGKNSQKLSLENYVLIYYLNHILDNANRHFLRMTNNRYQLVRKKEKSQGLSGLEIEVFDRFSNRTRHITSLSGGETFQASLSLAIGLSDVVQQEAGAIHLESMFIDEGFGTLDSETLETALDTLVNIQMSGRLVGIISHVSELKTRIPTILNVNKNGFLSTTSFSYN
ncbi:SMC family ATPase [Mammaliicoccus vitulinus]|uniref:exonuclease subunit SbcC n=1 Tax=Mammaliicoccus vitulinus TaxID=71237 RepID=UPI002DB91A57|nr:exonuclease subunit SbcC [Mammaliicoccus vitulinus]MEB7656671.1 SMC family ATPase [Mammaliicoccus vitulinus]